MEDMGFFSLDYCKTRENGLKLHQGRFTLHITIFFFFFSRGFIKLEQAAWESGGVSIPGGI